MKGSPKATGTAIETLLAQGVAAFRAGQLAEARRCAEAAQAAQPNRVEPLHLLARTLAKAGETAQALELWARAAALQPAQPEFPYRHAMLLVRADRIAESLHGFEEALRRQPDHASARLNRAVALHRLDRLPEALAQVAVLLGQKPGLAEAWTLRAQLLEGLGRRAEAVVAETRATALQPGVAAAQTRLSQVLLRAGEAEAALAHAALALAAAPDDPAALLARGLALQALRRHAEALSDLRAALPGASEPMAVEAALASSLVALGDWAAAQEIRLRSFAATEAALAAEPGDAALRNRRSLQLSQLDRLEETLEALDALPPDEATEPQRLLRRGVTLFGLQREEEALRCYAAAIALKPEEPRPHFDVSMHRLAMGDMPAAWAEYEWRWKVPDFPSARRPFTQPLWRGEALGPGRTLLLHAEQGLGDTLQFCRYAALAAARSEARVVLEVQPQLVGLMRRLAGPAQVLANGEPLPAFDAHCPLLSLPLAFGTSLETIPAPVPYLTSDPALREAWRRRLGPAGRRRIALVWAGNSANGTDLRRSMPLASAAALLGLDAEIIGLQMEVPARDEAALAAMPGLRMVGPDCPGMEPTAAVVSLMDAVVTVDTSMAHLAGALGRPVFVLLAQPCDWRWMLRREDSPWYPTARLLRQRVRGDWDEVIARLVPLLAQG